MDGTNDRFACESAICNHSSTCHNNLLRHYRDNPSHRPTNFVLKSQGRPKESADDVISSCFHEQLAPKTRSSRAKAFIAKLSDEELKKYCLPRLRKIVKPWEFLLDCAHNSSGLQMRHVASSFLETRDFLAQKYPELVSNLFGNNNNVTLPHPSSKEHLLNLIDNNKHYVCDYIISGNNKQLIFKDILMTMVYEQHKELFLDFACGVVGSLCVSQRDTQDLLRNTWGRKIAEVLGFNIFPPKDTIVKCLNSKKEELSEEVGLQFEDKSNGILVATVNVQKYLTFLLSRPGLQNAITFPKGAMLVYQYTDLAPWLKWSRFSNGITTSRIKVVDPYNLHSLVITCGAYLGQDDYNNLNVCFKGLYDQIASLNEVQVSGSPITVYKRSTADGKQRRVDSGNSSAKSTYPICDAPEHCAQLGDMALCSSGPAWTVKDTNDMAIQYTTWLNGKVDNAQNRREFAKTHLGNQGRINLVGCDMADYYIGGIHLAFRSAESICHRIGQCATGLLDSSKKYYKAMPKLARNVNKEDGTIKFDEIGVLAFGEKMPTILKEAGFSGIPLDILMTFTAGLSSIYTALLDTPYSLTGCQFECLARILLGFQFVLIFGTSCVTPSIKQIVVYTSYYIDKARNDGELVGLPIKFSNFSDGVMETAHKYAKGGTFLYSGGRHGATSSLEYQKLILAQLFHNELYRVAEREGNILRSTETKVSRKRHLSTSTEDEYSQHLSSEDLRAISSRKVQIPVNCNQLKQQILESSKEFQEEIQYINMDSAVEFSNALGSKAVILFHVDSCSINDELIYQRSDHRVSKEMLHCKVYFNPARYEFVVEHHLPQSMERQRIRFYFNHVMGMSVSGKSLILDAYQPPHFEVKTKITTDNKCVFPSKWNSYTNCPHLLTPPPSKHRIEIRSHEVLDRDLLDKFSGVQVLAHALETSLLDNYPNFTPFSREDPHERMPILKDPTLVRAAQMAVLEIAEDPRGREDVEFVVKMYKSIERVFRQLLKDRVNSSTIHEE